MSEMPLTRNIKPGGVPLDLAAYERAGGYQAVRSSLGRRAPADLVQTIVDSDLAGCGGGGFSTGKKWQAMPPAASRPGPRYFVVNADEMEPGTFKDRLLMEGDPHQLLEGVILSAYALQAETAYIFIRGEYVRAIQRLTHAAAEAEAAGLLGPDVLGSGYGLRVHIHGGAGRYICGEETALLNALEGRRPVPRAKPPFPQSHGLWGQPTVVNNVETVCNIPHIIRNGAAWYRGLGRNGEAGTRVFGVSGRVRKPGAYELPAGSSLSELIEIHAGGMQPGYALRAVLPGGASTGFLNAEHVDTAMSATALAQRGTRLGTGNAIVLDDRTCPVGFIANLQRFFARESCGWCAPCRDGLPWVEKLLNAIEAGDGEEADLDVLQDMTGALGTGKTFCALAPGAMASLQTGLDYFADEFRQHIRSRACPWT